MKKQTNIDNNGIVLKQKFKSDIFFLFTIVLLSFSFLFVFCFQGELLTIYASLPTLKETQMYSFSLPNQYNIAFNFYYFMWFTMFGYIPSKCYSIIWVLKVFQLLYRPLIFKFDFSLSKEICLQFIIDNRDKK